MKQTTKSRVSKPASTEAVKFSDGMLVTAEDLSAAMHYPLSVVQVLLRSFFGCGIVCGLDLTNPAEAIAAAPPAGDKPAGAGAAAAKPESPAGRGFVVSIGAGVALGCDGYPIELCAPVRLDLSPDPCACPTDAEPVKYIAIRRVTAVEAPAHGCGCGAAAGPAGQQCSRVRDHVLIQAFDSEDLPKGICRRQPADPAGRPAAAQDACQCMKQCSDCDRCAEPWVLLGTVRVEDKGLAPGGINDLADGKSPDGGRRYVKPIACACDAPRPAATPDVPANA